MKTKEIKGITLITLAVTIVVLLILAGISINTVVGDNGIIKKAQSSAELTKESEAKEIINRTILEFYLTNDYETLEDFLNTKVSEGRIDKVEKNADGTLKVWKNDYSVTTENKTNSSNGSGSGGNTGENTGGETQTPEVTVGEIKIVADSTGTGKVITDAGSVYLGNSLYITFSHSITGGTTTVDKEIPYAVTQNGTYTFIVTGIVNGKSYTKNVSVEVNQFKEQYMSENTKVTFSDGDVWVPEKFRISAESATTVSNGVVIEDEDGNQFVWIPVENISTYKRTAYLYSIETSTIDTSTNSIKIKHSSEDNYYYTEALATDEKTSVATYKGYYIGRYEAGDKESTASKMLRSENSSTNNTVTIKKGQAPYTYLTRNQAKTLAESFSTKQGYKAKTRLISSYAWDTAIDFIQKTVKDYGKSSPEGNYADTTFQYEDITGIIQTKASGSGVIIPTGQTTPVCNIYDMGGNADEWSTELSSEVIESYKIPYTIRGSNFAYNYANSGGPVAAAGFRRDYADENSYFIAFRITLFI